jgi:hypothetical protein
LLFPLPLSALAVDTVEHRVVAVGFLIPPQPRTRAGLTLLSVCLGEVGCCSTTPLCLGRGYRGPRRRTPCVSLRTSFPSSRPDCVVCLPCLDWLCGPLTFRLSRLVRFYFHSFMPHLADTSLSVSVGTVVLHRCLPQVCQVLRRCRPTPSPHFPSLPSSCRPDWLSVSLGRTDFGLHFHLFAHVASKKFVIVA